jgi:hypothetical protein
LYKPEVPVVWNEKVKDLFDFCKQDAAKRAARKHVEELKEPPGLQLPCPPLDRSAAKHFRELAKGQDKVKVTQALAALNLDTKLISYQKALKEQVKLSYEMARLLASDKPAVPELLRVCSSQISLFYAQNGEFVGDRRESAAFYLDQNVELARGLPMPEEKEALFDKAFVLATEAEQKKAQILYQQPPVATVSDLSRPSTSQRYRAYGYPRRNAQESGVFRNPGYKGQKKPWQVRNNAMPMQNPGKCN